MISMHENLQRLNSLLS